MNSCTISPVPKETFDEIALHDFYYRGRWEYYSVAQQMVMSQNPKSVLEIGAPEPIFVGSDILNFPGDPEKEIIRHDITIVPWPIEDKHYDFVVALQVWEHLNPYQERAFREVQRVSHKAVLSFPLNWKNCKADDDHYNITEETIAKWTLETTPRNRSIIGKRNKRLILFFDFTKS